VSRCGEPFETCLTFALCWIEHSEGELCWSLDVGPRISASLGSTGYPALLFSLPS
jgi:hypothetical protein